MFYQRTIPVTAISMASTQNVLERKSQILDWQMPETHLVLLITY